MDKYQYKEEKIEVENFILKTLESPEHCDETGGINPEMVIEKVKTHFEWDKNQIMDVIEGLKNDGYIVQANDGYIALNFNYYYPMDCICYPDECASVMWIKHKNKCVENSLKVNNNKLSFLKSLGDDTFNKIIDRMMGIVEDRETTHKIELAYPTKHLLGYDKLSQATGIIGREYRIIKKITCYSILSTKIANKTLRLGRIKTDGRISILVVLGSGKGKSEFKSLIKDVLKEIDVIRKDDDDKEVERKVQCEEVSAYHPDQFIGKVKVHNNKNERTTTPIKGFLALDYLILDEALDLLKAKEPVYKESCRALRLGADGKEIYKKNVDAHLDEALKYKTKCVLCLFAQPIPLDSDFVLKGDARRVLIGYVNLHGTNQDEARIKNITDDEVNEKTLIEEITAEFNNLTVPYEFKVDDGAKKTFEELYELLYQRGMTYSHKIADYTEINKFTMANMLLKMAAIQALQSGSDTITEKHVKLAFMDYCEILEHTYEYIETRVMGELNYSEKWQGAAGRNKAVLGWLHGEGATSKETSKVSIADYKNKIKEYFDVEDRQAGYILKKHRTKGWVESTQSKHSSKIWITFIPDFRVAGVAEVQPGVYKKIQNKYYEIINKYELYSDENGDTTLQPCTHCTPEDIEVLDDALKELEMEINEEKTKNITTKYLMTAYENDIKDMKREMGELSEFAGYRILELAIGIETYSRALEKLKSKIKTPTAIVNQPFSLINRQKTAEGQT